MARIPKYPTKPHSSGLARICVHGRRIYLGKFQSPESYVKYHQVIAEVQAGKVPTVTPARRPGNEVTVAGLIRAFLSWASGRYVKNGKPTSEIKSFAAALRPVLRRYADIPAKDFGPSALINCRDELVATGYTRKRINQHIGRICRVWRWGVQRELVPGTTHYELRQVGGLRKGEGGVKDNPRVRPPALDLVNSVETLVPPPVWAMIQMQLHTSCRPGEACIIRTCDITENDSEVPAELRCQVWVYRPESHKTEHHDQGRMILIGPKCQEILRPWLRPDDPTAYLFSPRAARAWRDAKVQSKSRGTRLQPRKRKRKPRRLPGAVYGTHAYSTAVHRACERRWPVPEGIKDARAWKRAHRWFPNQLRHLAATLIRAEYGAEIARVILGHSKLSTTEIYAERDLGGAARAIARMG